MAASSPRSIQHSLHPPARLLPTPLSRDSPASPPTFLLKPPTTTSSSTTSTTTTVSTHSSTSSTATSSPAPRPWVSALLSTKFYGPCPHHPSLRKNDLNLFCTRHAAKICQYCHHASHLPSPPCTILHVSRYMYHDVLLAKEAAALLDVSDVQSYLNNGNRVVYIDRRAQPKSKLAPHAKACAVCSRTLQDPYRFCSVFCRLAHANDPAAVASLPVPDASPLLHHNVRKHKPSTPSAPHSPRAQQKKVDRSAKRVPSAERSESVSVASVALARAGGKAVARLGPPGIAGKAIRKKSKRKGTPVRSPTLYSGGLLLSYGTCM